MSALKLKIIMGSVRERRFNEHATKWIADVAKQRSSLDVEVLDLRDWPFPFYSDAKSSSVYKNGDYPTDLRKKFASKIKEADGIIFVTPEYNNSTSGVLKNAIDQVFAEWNYKPGATVSYGSTGGARAASALRTIMPEVHMAAVRTGVYIPAPWTFVDENNQLKAGALEPFAGSAKMMLDQMEWWGHALKVARSKK
jgi:NAD(P)H-dependent FMN reductase